MVGPFGGPTVMQWQLSGHDPTLPPPSGFSTAPSSFHKLPPTIIEGDDEEEVDVTRTGTATYVYYHMIYCVFTCT